MSGHVHWDHFKLREVEGGKKRECGIRLETRNNLTVGWNVMMETFERVISSALENGSSS